MEQFTVLIGVLAVATVGGLLWQARSGRLRTGQRAPSRVWDSIGVNPRAASATLVQFSSPFCSPCRHTRELLSAISQRLPEISYVEIDAGSHLDAVRALKVFTTPTTLLVDRGGRVVQQAVGQPRENDIVAALRPYLRSAKR